LFNLNVGRDLMPAFDLEPQVVMTTPLLEGLDGVEKMSKSLGNYVGVTDAPADMFGKLMSISDDLMWKYFTLLTDLSPSEVLQVRNRVSAGDLHPKQAKVDLASRIVSDFHGTEAAAAAAQEFDRRFSKRELPDELPTIDVPDAEWGAPIERMLVRSGLASSMADARRKLQQGGVKINGERQSSGSQLQDIARREADEFVLQAGKLKAVRLVRKRA
jgi:tyrosyl-tRNA synthetase